MLATLSPEDPAVHLNLAECYRSLSRFDPAIAEGRKAVELEPSPGPKNNLATYYFLNGDSHQARTLAHEVLREDPTDSRALYLIASCDMADGKEGEADTIWRQLLAAGNDSAARARSALADAALVRDEPKEAAAQLQNGLILDLNRGNHYEFTRSTILLGEIYRASGDHK